MKASRVIAAFSILCILLFSGFQLKHTLKQFSSVTFAENIRMSTVHFKLRSPDADRPVSINLRYCFDGKWFVASTRRKIHPQDWDFRRERPKASYPSAQSLTAYLNSLQAAIIDRHNYMLAIGQYPTLQDFRQAIAERSGRVNIGRPTLLQHMDKLCNAAPDKSFYHKLRTQVQRFAKSKRLPVQMEAINAAWFNDFQSYLIANNAEGYAYRLAKQFKTAIRQTGFDWEGKAAILAAELRATATPSEKVYLDFEELRGLLPIGVEVANMLYLSCITGLRISDWSKYTLSGDLVDCGEYRFVRIVMQKLRKQSGIRVAYPPLLPAAEKILQAHGGAFLPPSWAHLSDKEALRVLFNRQCREAAQLAGITAPTTLLQKQRGETTEVTGPKWQFVSSKIGRNSFVTNFRSLGIPDRLLNLMTGHAGEKAMANAYDMAQFKERAPLLFSYLREFEERLRGGSKYNQETIFTG